MNIQRRIDPATPATYADIEALPDHITGEIIYGALHTQPRPAPKHALAHSRLCGALSDGFDQKRAIYAEIGVTYLWHVDPDAQTLEGFVLRDGQWLLTHMRSGDDICDVPPFDAAPFSLGALWTV